MSDNILIILYKLTIRTEENVYLYDICHMFGIVVFCFNIFLFPIHSIYIYILFTQDFSISIM